MEDLVQTELSVEMLKATVTHVENLVALLGTTQDNKQLRGALDATREEAKRLEKDIALVISRLRDPKKGEVEAKFEKIRDKWKKLYKDSYQKEKFLSKTPIEEQELKLNFEPQPSRVQFASKDEILKDLAQERTQQVQTIKKDMNEVVDLFSQTAKLVENQKPMMDVIETQVEEAEEQTEEGIQNIAKASKDQAFSLPVSGAAVGGVVGGGLGLLLGPMGVVLGGTTGATVGSMVGKSLGQMQKDTVDKELFEHYLKDKWLSDEQVLHCMLCKTEFTAVIRKHHCRSCGGIFCWQCSDKKLAFKLPNLDTERVERVCRTCFRDSWMMKQ